MTRSWLSGVALGTALVLSGAARADVILGVVGPITGSSAAFGMQLKNGAGQAVTDINKAGGILGQKIKMILGDDVSDPKQGVSVANDFVGDGVKFVVGDFNSGVSIPASDVYEENGIVQITPASTNPAFTERGMWNVFRTCGRDDQQGAVAADYIYKHFKGKTIAIIDDKTTYGKGLADVVRKDLHAKGMKEALDEGVNTGEKDFSAVVSRIKEDHVDLVYWGGLQTEGGLIVRQMREQGVNATLMGADGIATEEFASIGGPGVIGTLMTYGPDPTKKPEAAKVVKEFAARQINPEAYTLYSYAAVQVIQQAADKAKSLDPKKVAAVMHSGMTFHTVIGSFAYDKKGDRTDSDYVVYKWEKLPDGKISYVQL